MQDSSAAVPRASVQVRVWLAVLVCVLLSLSWIAPFVLLPRLYPMLPAEGQSPKPDLPLPVKVPPPPKPVLATTSRGKGGAWGTLEWSKIIIAPSEDYVTLDLCPTRPEPWTFPKHSHADVARLLNSASLDKDQRTALLDAIQCHADNGGCVVDPPVDVLLELSLTSRSVVNRVLAQFSENQSKLYAYRFLVQERDQILEGSQLAPKTRDVVAELSYPGQGHFIFADLFTACARVEQPAEKLRLIRALARTNALLVSLRVGPGMDIDDLISYWGSGRRTKDIRPLLESLAKFPGEVSLDIAHLLTPFARSRLNSFPKPTDPSWDCHWTAMNFWRTVPDDRFLDGNAVRDEIAASYYQVENAFPRFGDLVILLRPSGQVLHSFIYIAEDIVFTKNGRSARKPWVLMKMNQVIIEYFNEMSFDVLFYRSRDL